MTANRRLTLGRGTAEASPRSQDASGSSQAPRVALQGTLGVPEPSTAVLWRFSLPYPPSTNNLYMTVRGRRVKTQEARDYTDLVGDMASILKVRRGVPIGPYRLMIELWAPDLRRRDADNGVKCLQDALLKAVGRDDAEVVELFVVKRGVDRIHPRADVTLEGV